jgi:hypothetical protein
MKGDVIMEKRLKKGICLVGIYAFILVLIFAMSDRITKLDKQNNVRGSISLIK